MTKAAQKKPSKPAAQRRSQKPAKKPNKPAKYSATTVDSKGKGLHQRNLHRDGYDFDKLTQACPVLTPFVRPNPYGKLSIDFADPQAVKALNFALLKSDYQIEFWDIPQGFLCPPIPGRVDYIHYLEDLLRGELALEDELALEQSGQNVHAESKSLKNSGKNSRSSTKRMKINALDIGTGANLIYPILASQACGWRCVASDVDPLSIKNAANIINHNRCLQGKIETRLQTDHQKVFSGVISADERFDVTLCNPPFHSSLAEAAEGSQRKVQNLAANRAAKGHASNVDLSKEKLKAAELNFGGQKAELWCDGGEKQFLLNMISESREFKTQCLWFTSLVSKKENLKSSYAALEKVGAVTVKTIDMAQGNKLTRVLAWSFLTPAQRDLWAKYRS
ncbi:23S rRNA (adenine(1618)-N(6))-methyltransferase RlmF [Shewanella sp. UCD-KL12]|uniref:23S rRNA (adenine(1618)-N(6))-methyltransferase RlmF n=1 Tax=Shewanella sp. UCD-KL12 TaxID=1917163 RepID=UPI0009711AA3|nr:23S rRNA (adenine(1618)-N(6))-methyltransferase RlmF [Shewanella sp. UCD-KL12]